MDKNMIGQLRKAKFKPPKKIKPLPIKLRVSFPTLEGPGEIKQSKFNRMLNRIKKMSDNEFVFVFDSVADCFRVIPD